MASPTGGYTPKTIVSAASNNAQVLKAGPGVVGIGTVFNVSASPIFLKFYDKATTPSPAADTPVFVVPMPGNANGAGAVIPFGNIIFVNGISFAIVTGIAINDNTSVGAGDCCVSLGYR
jgi:hypothetical protein